MAKDIARTHVVFQVRADVPGAAHWQGRALLVSIDYRNEHKESRWDDRSLKFGPPHDRLVAG